MNITKSETRDLLILLQGELGILFRFDLDVITFREYKHHLFRVVCLVVETPTNPAPSTVESCMGHGHRGKSFELADCWELGRSNLLVIAELGGQAEDSFVRYRSQYEWHHLLVPLTADKLVLEQLDGPKVCKNHLHDGRLASSRKYCL